jgi:glutaminyl-tRNA synthetase
MSADSGNFIRDIIDRDLASGKHVSVVTRFPPEPNGYLHVGHAKSICLNFGLARDYGGRCHLRFDDTNPTTEDMEYVESIQRDVRWLGFDWGEHLYFASDYFEQLYEQAVHLITTGKAYVDSLSEDEVRAYRGSVTEPGKNSPFRDRPVAESLALFERMRRGDFKEGEHVVRAKIDMASPNMKMRDPPIYRIKHAAHYRTGDAWCIYPLYDFTHCLSDAFERITHSICTLEFENNRELYDWVLDRTPVECHPQQIEFARLNLSFTLMSKRKLLQLVNDEHVAGWDDPRMPTIAGMRRRGYTPAALRTFAEMVGVARNNSLVDIGKLEFCIRDDLNTRAPRVMCVLRPLKLTLRDFPADRVDTIDAPSFPPDVDRAGSRRVPLSRTLYIERDDFEEQPPRGFHRLSPGAEVRLRYAGVVRCEEVVKNDRGEVIELIASYHPDADRKVKGTIHWVSAAHARDCEVRLYDRLFVTEEPSDLSQLNPDSLRVLSGCKIEPSVGATAAGPWFQFERQGYFCFDAPGGPDAAGATPSLVFNRTVTLRDTWAKLQARERGEPRHAGRPARETAAAPRAAKPKAARPALEGGAAERFEALCRDHGLSEDDARVIAADDVLSQLFTSAMATAAKPSPQALANWLVNSLAALRTEAGARPPFGGDELAELVVMVESGRLSGPSAKEVLAIMLRQGGRPQAIVAERGLEKVADQSALAPLVAAVVRDHPSEAERYRGGKDTLLAFFVGQVMRKSGGKADASVVRELLKSELGG